MPTFGEYIRALRKSRNLSYRMAANRLGISFTYLYRLEAGTTPPAGEETIRVFAEVYNANFDYLMHLAGRISADCETIVVQDPDMPALLRWAEANGWTGASMHAALRQYTLAETIHATKPDLPLQSDADRAHELEPRST
jgi:transcriptional regulator with XRE-family HTH domain